MKEYFTSNWQKWDISYWEDSNGKWGYYASKNEGRTIRSGVIESPNKQKAIWKIYEDILK
jgi:hypothetical protein